MNSIMTNLNQWIFEHCATQEDVQNCINLLQNVKNSWGNNENKELRYEPKLKTYHVIIHYEGACEYDVVARSEEEAEEIAENKFSSEDAEDILDGTDFDVCDIWEV